MRPRTLLLGPVVALAAAAPASAAEFQVNASDAPAWDAPAISVAAGDTVTWRFDATLDIHNVQPEEGAWMPASPPGRPAQPWSFTFTTAGTYKYLCVVHSAMKGYVLVGDAPPPPPPPLSEQPFTNDSTLPAALETGGLDQERPSVGGVRVRRSGGAAQLRFRVSEPSEVTIRFKRGGKIVATRHVRVAGTYRMAVRASRALRAGRYRVELRARDGAGNDSRMRSAHLTVR